LIYVVSFSVCRPSALLIVLCVPSFLFLETLTLYFSSPPQGFEKNMPILSRASASGDFERGLIVRVKANGNYDVEKSVEDLCPERLAAVRKQIDRTGIRITMVTDSNVPPEDIQEMDGARFKAFGIAQDPDWELSVLSQCRQFNLRAVARLLGTEFPKPMTYGLNRSGLY